MDEPIYDIKIEFQGAEIVVEWGRRTMSLPKDGPIVGRRNGEPFEKLGYVVKRELCPPVDIEDPGSSIGDVEDGLPEIEDGLPGIEDDMVKESEAANGLPLRDVARELLRTNNRSRSLPTVSPLPSIRKSRPIVATERDRLKLKAWLRVEELGEDRKGIRSMINDRLEELDAEDPLPSPEMGPFARDGAPNSPEMRTNAQDDAPRVGYVRTEVVEMPEDGGGVARREMKVKRL